MDSDSINTILLCYAAVILHIKIEEERTITQ